MSRKVQQKAKPRGQSKAARPGAPRRWPWILLLLTIGWLGFEFATLPSQESLARLATQMPAETALMRARKAEAASDRRKLKLRRTPVRFDAIARDVPLALIASEDARFFVHEGLDLKEVHQALRKTVVDGKRLRGASTLTQQLAKNLYLSEDRSLLRKVKEAWIAGRLEQSLSKRRILELYLNSVEWGDGVFGIEAAARVYLDKSASQISLAEAAALVSMLPNPRRFGPGHPEQLHRRALHVLDRMADERFVKPDQVAQAREELEHWLGNDAQPRA